MSFQTIELIPEKESSNHSYERYKFIFENSPVPIHETNVTNVAKAISDLKANGVTNIEEYILLNPNFIPDLFYDSDIFDVNDAMLEMTEADSKEYYLENFKTILGQPCFHFFQAIVIASFNGQNKLSGETEISTFKGRKIWINATAMYLSMNGEEIINYTFREVTERKLKNQAIKLINERLVTGDFQEHLNNLVSALSEAFNLPYVFIGVPNKAMTEINTLALLADQTIQDNVAYTLADSPCSELYERNEKIIYSNHLSKIFSKHPVIQSWKGQSYLAYPLRSKRGKVIGHFAFVNTQPIQNMDSLQDVMELYASWASTELENISNQKALQERSTIIERQLTTLNEKNQKLERYIESNMQLENFAYIASHDLKAPIRTIISFSQLLARSLKGKLDKNSSEYLEFIVSASRNMKELIEDLLAYSIIDGQPFQPTTIKLENLLTIVTSELYSTIEEQEAIVKWKNMPVITGDYTKLKQLFQNLIANAIKFRKKEEAPIVKIKCKEKKNYWKCSVKDNGIGVKEEHFENIFALFQKLHTKVEYEGTGLGLAICKKIIEKHNGKIWIESEYGVGTTFHFTIPK